MTIMLSKTTEATLTGQVMIKKNFFTPPAPEGLAAFCDLLYVDTI